MELGIAHWNGGGSMLGVDMLTLAEGIWAEGDKLPLLRGALWNVSERPLSLFDPRKRTRSNSRERIIGWWNDVRLSGPTLSQRFGACAFCGERLLGKKGIAARRSAATPRGEPQTQRSKIWRRQSEGITPA